MRVMFGMFNTRTWYLLGLCLTVVIVAIVGYSMRKGNAPTTPPPSEGGLATSTEAGIGGEREEPGETQTTPTIPAPATRPTPRPKTQSTPASTQTKPLSLLSPLPGAEWVFGHLNEIKWSREVGLNGSMYLLDPITKVVIGWITPNVGPHQTSLVWDTKSLALSRTNPQKKDIAPGLYILRVKFDGPAPTLESSLSIVYPSQAKIPTYAVVIQGFAVIPSRLTVKKGEQVVFTNNDSVSYQLKLSSFTSYTLGPGDSQTLDTKILNPGIYEVYAAEYPSVRGVLVVE